MAKKSKHRRHLSDRSLKRPQDSKPNPFDLKFNKLKQNILGRRPKDSLGLPSQSHQTSLDLRTRSLLPEYKNFHKVSRLIDRRLGEHDPSLSQEEKLSRRFALERSRRFRKDKFLLEESDPLTHLGHSLSDPLRIDRPLHDSDSETELDSAHVSSLHFGGLPEEGNANLVERRKSRKELIAELISRSKAAKYERQMERDQTDELTSRADSKWKELLDVLPTMLSKDPEEKPQKKEPDPYDVLVRELQFAPRPIKPQEPKTPVPSEEPTSIETPEVEPKKPKKHKRVVFASIDEDDFQGDSSFKFLAPRIEQDFNPERKTHARTPKSQRARLVHAVKREERAAKRELRKDGEFLARVQLGEEAEKDQERKRKMKELMQGLQEQQSEGKKYDRMKKKK